MKQKNNVMLVSLVAFSLVLFASSSSIAAGIPAATTPSSDVILSFTQPGRITQVLVAMGDRVQKDQSLIQQDDAAERLQLAQIEAQCNNPSKLEASAASLIQKRVALKKIERAAASDVATELELESAKLDVRMAELTLEITKLEYIQNRMKCDEAKIRVGQMSLRSPIAGAIEKIVVEPGESVNALADVVRIVKTDPLWIDVPVPLAMTKRLGSGQTASVEFPDSPPVTIKGKVIFIATVADAASGTLLVRVETPNKDGRPAGEHVKVHFPVAPKDSSSNKL